MNYKGLCNQKITLYSILKKNKNTSYIRTVLDGCYFETSKKYINNTKGRTEISDPFCIIPKDVLGDIKINAGDKIFLGEIFQEFENNSQDFARFNPENMLIVSDIAYKHYKNRIMHIEIR